MCILYIILWCLNNIFVIYVRKSCYVCSTHCDICSFLDYECSMILLCKLDILLCMFSIMWGMHVQYFEINFRSSCYAYFAMNVLASFLNIVGYIMQMRSIVSSERTDESNWWCNFQIVHVHINYSVVNAR